MGQNDHLADHLVEIQVPLARRHLLEEFTNPAYHFTAAMGVLGDSFYRYPRFLDIRRLPAEPAQRGAGVDRIAPIGWATS